jgi:hypothetical protein
MISHVTNDFIRPQQTQTRIRFRVTCGCEPAKLDTVAT